MYSVPPGFSIFSRLFEANQVSLGVDGISVSPQAKMFDRMQAGQGVTDIGLDGALVHQIHSFEVDVFMPRVLKLPHVDDLNGPKGRDVSDKAIDSGPDIDMADRIVPGNVVGNQQVLMEIMAACRTCLFSVIRIDGEELVNPTASLLESEIILQEANFVL